MKIALYQRGHHDLQVCQVSRNYLSYFQSYGNFSAIFCIFGIGKNEYFLSYCILSPKNDFVWEIIEYMICRVSNNVKFSSISGYF
jgi:hypothetical protein